MTDPASGPFLFDTSAESWLARAQQPAVQNWLRQYLGLHQVYVSAVTVLERSRGYALLWRSVADERRSAIEAMRVAYLSQLGRVFALDSATAVVAGEIMALIPQPPTPPRRSHGLAESRSDRLSRWRFDALIAATEALSSAFELDCPLKTIFCTVPSFEIANSRVTMPRVPRRAAVGKTACQFSFTAASTCCR